MSIMTNTERYYEHLRQQEREQEAEDEPVCACEGRELCEVCCAMLDARADLLNEMLVEGRL